MQDVLVVGIAGGTGSGKTTFAKAVMSKLEGKATFIAHDSYYRAHDNMPYEERAKLNYDHPDAYETDLLVHHLEELKAGRSIEVPTYDFSQHNRVPQTTTVTPSPIILVEGIMVLADERLRNLMDIKVFVDVDADIRILRRLKRDVEERGRSVQSVMDQYLATVRPMHYLFVEPSKIFANIVIPATYTNDVAQDVLLSYINNR
ncbi:MAG: uridine kinase [Atopobiaceae bacterium]|nr:uridine kinase [Atopobiaceae bacterium]